MKKTYKGEVVYLFAFDVGYELNPITKDTVLGQKLIRFSLENSKRGPTTSFLKPLMINLPPITKHIFNKTTNIQVSAKFLPMGVLSMMARVPFEHKTLIELVQYHDLKFYGQLTNLNEEVHSLANKIFDEIKPFLIKPVEKLTHEEAYTIFYIDSSSLGTSPTLSWLHSHDKDVASVLMEESDVNNLSKQEVKEVTDKMISYHINDLVLVDWDAALVVEQPSYLNEVLYVMELANIQLTELEAYDRILDDVVENSYKDLSDRKHGYKNKLKVLSNLKELRVDMARMDDEICNITKFFGDWHLAKIYKSLSDKFHLTEWQKTIDEKLNILDKIYETLKTEKYNKTILYLEWAVVVCFIIDLIIIGMELFKK